MVRGDTPSLVVRRLSLNICQTAEDTKSKSGAHFHPDYKKNTLPPLEREAPRVYKPVKKLLLSKASSTTHWQNVTELPHDIYSSLRVSL